METVASYPNHINKNSLSLLPSPPPLDGKLVHPGFTPSIQFTCSHFVYTWMKRGTVSQHKGSCPRTQHSVPDQSSNPDQVGESTLNMKPPLEATTPTHSSE